MKTHKAEIKKDERGTLLPLYSQDYDFDWKRCFVLKGSKEGTTRGNHGHKRENQIMLIISGTLELESDNGKIKETIVLNEDEYVVLPPLTWNTFTIKEENTVVLVMGSELFDEDEYIRDYNEFKSLICGIAIIDGGCI